MSIQRVLAIVRKEVKKTIREPEILFMIFLFPVVFMLAFSTFFGGAGGEQPIYEIGVVNMDEGARRKPCLPCCLKPGCSAQGFTVTTRLLRLTCHRARLKQ